MPARLIVNADDFGLTLGVNRAIGELHQAGAITSATLMATGPAFADAVRIAHALPGLGVGCHVAFVDASPLSEPSTIPSLCTANGSLRTSFGSFAQAVLRRRVRVDELVLEAVAQVQRLQRKGIAVTHLDTHKHTHILPAVHEALLIAAQRCGTGALRNPFEPPWARNLNPTPVIRRASFALLAGCFQPAFQPLHTASSPPVATTSGTVGIAVTGHLDRAALARILAALPPSGTWDLVVHPGYNDPELAATNTRLRASREIEREALLGIIPTLARNAGGPDLIHYGQL